MSSVVFFNSSQNVTFNCTEHSIHGCQQNIYLGDSFYVLTSTVAACVTVFYIFILSTIQKHISLRGPKYSALRILCGVDISRVYLQFVMVYLRNKWKDHLMWTIARFITYAVLELSIVINLLIIIELFISVKFSYAYHKIVKRNTTLKMLVILFILFVFHGLSFVINWEEILLLLLLSGSGIATVITIMFALHCASTMGPTNIRRFGNMKKSRKSYVTKALLLLKVGIIFSLMGIILYYIIYMNNEMDFTGVKVKIYLLCSHPVLNILLNTWTTKSLKTFLLKDFLSVKERFL